MRGVRRLLANRHLAPTCRAAKVEDTALETGRDSPSAEEKPDSTRTRSGRLQKPVSRFSYKCPGQPDGISGNLLRRHTRDPNARTDKPSVGNRGRRGRRRVSAANCTPPIASPPAGAVEEPTSRSPSALWGTPEQKLLEEVSSDPEERDRLVDAASGLVEFALQCNAAECLVDMKHRNTCGTSESEPAHQVTAAELGEIGERFLTADAPICPGELRANIAKVERFSNRLGKPNGRVSQAYTGIAHVCGLNGDYVSALHWIERSKIEFMNCFEARHAEVPPQYIREFDIVRKAFEKALADER